MIVKSRKHATHAFIFIMFGLGVLSGVTGSSAPLLKTMTLLAPLFLWGLLFLGIGVVALYGILKNNSVLRYATSLAFAVLWVFFTVGGWQGMIGLAPMLYTFMALDAFILFLWREL